MPIESREEKLRTPIRPVQLDLRVVEEEVGLEGKIDLLVKVPVEAATTAIERMVEGASPSTAEEKTRNS
jgi:hypothetical protein